MTAVWMWLVVSAYCPGSCCCGTSADGKTATGRDATKSGVAVDPKVIPLGSRLDIPGYSRTNGTSTAGGAWILADDVGGAIKGKRIDIRMQTHQEALNWGRKTLRVRVWRKKK